MPISTGCVSSSRQAARDSAAGRTPSGTARHTQAAATTASTATAREGPAPAERSRRCSAPSGMPSTEASDQPRKTKVMARPRCSGGAMWPIAAAACGVNTAAPSTLAARTGQQPAVVGHQRSTAAWPAAYQTSDQASSRRRSQPATTPAASGAPTAHHRGGDGDQLAGRAPPTPAASATRSFSEPATDHHAAADREVAAAAKACAAPRRAAPPRRAAQRPRPARRRHGAHRMHLQRFGVDDVGRPCRR